MSDEAEIAGRLSRAQRTLLGRHAEGWRSSLYRTQWLGDPASPYWASLHCTYAPPNYQAREALIRKGLIEPYNDAAGITPLGLAVRAHLLEHPNAD